jgi:hypothetical protein
VGFGGLFSELDTTNPKLEAIESIGQILPQLPKGLIRQNENMAVFAMIRYQLSRVTDAGRLGV